jgi:predicted DNA-binding transcriptional regulator AlpA
MKGKKVEVAVKGTRNQMDQVLKNTSSKAERPAAIGEKALINVIELSALTGISRRSLFNLMADSEFPRIKVGRKLLFDKHRVLDFIRTKYGNL